MQSRLCETSSFLAANMASHHGSTQSEPAEIEQIITETSAKILHIIHESRGSYVSSRNYSSEQFLSSPSPPSSSCSSSSFGLRDKSFKLALRDCPAALENIGFWHQSNFEPMIVDVILVRRSGNWDPVNYFPKKGFATDLSGKERYHYSSENDEIDSEKIIERWVLQYESKQSGDNCGGVMGNKRATCAISDALYKKSIMLLRSLYATVRLLPAYKVFRDLISSAQIRGYNLCHRVSSFVEPFTSREEADMQSFVFSPLNTACGSLCLSVMYCSSELDIISEPSTPISPQVIHEYVGSPMAEPLKRFTPGPVPQCSTSTSPFGRRHSWRRPGSFDQPGGLYPVGKSQDAAAPFHMLNKVPPLRPDISITTNLVQDSKSVIEEFSLESLLEDFGSLNLSSSGLASTKTTADAFTELVEYKKMKEVLLKQGKGTQA
ncbi:unnamed protein product [Fraxinus pennsylvanica]|uniref:Autophagy-related protein 13 N-terminal domain-containing protein n=1 Tax=Fraxinus pennsylvanica TaxID=56036 RepID=A0AAD1Z602_9LAMI|nr:unnamed protein product [Fraxinus pennsylvanica]